MAAFLMFSKIQTFAGIDAKPLIGGSLSFFDAGTTTPKNVFGNIGLTINNGVTVALDGSGRPNVEVWGDGNYYVVVLDALGAQQGVADNLGIYGQQGSGIPSLVADRFLKNNGSIMIWEPVLEVPDPSGQNGKILEVVGTTPTWRPKPPPPVIPPSDTAQTVAAVKIGNMWLKTGTGTASTFETVKARSTTVTFDAPFTSTPVFFGVTVTSQNLSTLGNMPTNSIVPNLSSMFVRFVMSDLSQSDAGWNFNGPVTFNWFAMGVITP